jgi:hypothetical protein
LLEVAVGIRPAETLGVAMTDSDQLALDDALDELDSAKDQSQPLNLTQDERKLITQPYDLGVRNLSDDIERGRLRLTVEYQRKYVWDQAKASRLIESLLLNVPIPVCYFAEDDDGSYEVIDGLQRLTTIDKYFRDEFPLSGVSVLKELDGKRFGDLAVKDQRRLENRTIRCIVITAESHPDIKFDVFERLNTGAASLSAQELRNCIYRGTFNDQLKLLAQDARFTRILGPSSNQRMEHEELVLRFLSLAQDISAYKPPLRQLLNKLMRENRTTTARHQDVQAFLSTCDTVHEVFADSAFRIAGADGRFHRTVNKAVFDSIMMSFLYADDEQLKADAPRVRHIRDQLLADPDFRAAIGRATADRTRMFYRINALTDRLREIGVYSRLPRLEA